MLQISLLDFRNRRPGLDGHNLYFSIYTPKPISAADMPLLVLSTSSEGLQVAEFPASFSAPSISANTPATCPAARWIEVRIPLDDIQSASIYTFRPEYMQSLTLLPGTALTTSAHTLIVDEIRVADAPSFAQRLICSHRISAPPATIATSNSNGTSGDPAGLARYVIYRSEDGGKFTPIGTQIPGIHRYEDFLGKSGVHASYKIAAADWSFHESPPIERSCRIHSRTQRR